MKNAGVAFAGAARRAISVFLCGAGALGMKKGRVHRRSQRPGRRGVCNASLSQHTKLAFSCQSIKLRLITRRLRAPRAS